MLGFTLRCGPGVLLGTVVAWLGIAEHRAWVYLAGIGAVAVAVAVIAWQGWTRWRGVGRARWLAATVAGVVVAVPSIGLPWQAYRAQQPEQADWLVERTADEQYAIDDLLYTRDDTGWYVVDTRSGEVTADLPIRKRSKLLVGQDGVTYERDSRAVTAYDATGAQLWRRRGDAIAATATTTVVRHCGPFPSWPRPPCGVRGIDTASGRVRWTRDLIVTDRAERRLPGLPVAATSPSVLPQVVLARTRDPADLFSIDADTGRTLQRFRATDVGVSGDLVVGATESDRGCVLRGYRGGDIGWETTAIPGGCPSAPMRLLESRLYVHLSSDETVTVDLADGSWRRCGRVELVPGEYDDDNRTGEGSEDVIVYRDGPGEVYGVDADTGAELWRHEAPGDRPVGLAVGHGTVAVLSPAESHNPFVPEDVADDGYLVTVLDAATGEVTGRWTGPEVQDVTAVGSGAAVVTAGDRMWPVGS